MIPYRFFNKPSLDLQSFFDEFYNLRNVLEKSFEGEMGKDQILFRNRVRPPVNIFETPDLFVIRAQVPGLEKDDIDLAVTGNSITLSYEKKEENDHKERKYNRRERNIKSFNRLIRLPSEINSEKIEAGLMNGVLTVAIQKVEKAKSKKIDIH